MAGSTTNLGLTKPTYSEDADIAVINTNMDTLDSKIGAVGSTSLQAQITSANEAISTLNSKIRSGSDGSVNLNNYITTGMYAFNGGTSLNAPASGASTLIVQRYSDDWISQMVTVITSNGSEVYVRDYHDGTTWSSWEKLALNSTAQVTLANGINLMKLGRTRIIACSNGSGEIPASGLATGEATNTVYYSKVCYFNGSNNVDGIIRIETDGKLYLFNGNNLNVKVAGTYVSGELVYFV